jgi:hypothetical protein
MATKKKKSVTKPKNIKTKKSVSVKRTSNETDSKYFLKLTVFLILGSQWVYIEQLPNWQIPIPVGLILGLVFASHEHFQIDRKVEYAVLIVATFISFWLPIGLVIQA